MTPTLALPAVLSSVGLITPFARSAEEARADRVTGLNEIGTIWVNALSEDMQDMEHIVAQKADERGASYYRIVRVQESQQPDNWRVQAILYA
ncbi:DUF1471 domain-containing protein [Erwinia sp. CPCC 100877]|nr:DUF1471 domain-containing protein [Erwinia sp. CPCC 100877]